MFREIFQKKPKKYATLPPSDVREKSKREIPEGLTGKCKKCNAILFNKELEKNLKVCVTCGYHFAMNARERVQFTLDEGRLFEYDSDMISEDPLEFDGYTEKLQRETKKSGLSEAVITGEGTIGGVPVVIAIMSFDFFTGSMGSVVGEKITRAIEKTTQKKYPLIVFSTASGARMQESILSLMQMAKTSAAIARFSEQGGFYISVLTNPTLGGVTASFASLGDIILAEPETIIGFAGRIVIEQTMRQKLPQQFQTAEFNLQHGQIDKVVHRKDMKSTLIKILQIHKIDTSFINNMIEEVARGNASAIR
ncbi:acetyl-CoA carboxylase, carboxyltransferase subunit beta [Paenibacillus allorhizosphaerae]|uniref:Acetyl-coenzyme A carboxylase carboxyl transferase subunit beta n=1 Tax=Paenibacillus allorhizosphaerae TaxID=2849866 RepID=A0ABM8VH24_9BACL|nr:acetyl-CoA carboxylase, carboxyltransferase subunit beta [Paenibacillus allorhizosphaerae]CAG7640317.1 Acetyl-coenzyme A carboxylase carboxyl transferase subunit beta [Paenibacillus allorhizosphaerae]